MHKIGNIGIIGNFVFKNNCGFVLYLEHFMLVSIKLDIIECNRITFQGCRFHWSSDTATPKSVIFEFFVNAFTKFGEFNDKNIIF